MSRVVTAFFTAFQGRTFGSPDLTARTGYAIRRGQSRDTPIGRDDRRSAAGVAGSLAVAGAAASLAPFRAAALRARRMSRTVARHRPRPVPAVTFRMPCGAANLHDGESGHVQATCQDSQESARDSQPDPGPTPKSLWHARCCCALSRNSDRSNSCQTMTCHATHHGPQRPVL